MAVTPASEPQVQGPYASPSPSQRLGMAVTNFQEMGTSIGAAMDRVGVKRDGITGTPPDGIRVPHAGRATPEQLRNLQSVMQSYADRTFGTGLRVRVDGVPIK